MASRKLLSEYRLNLVLGMRMRVRLIWTTSMKSTSKTRNYVHVNVIGTNHTTLSEVTAEHVVTLGLAVPQASSKRLLTDEARHWFQSSPCGACGSGNTDHKGSVALVLLSVWVCGTGNTDHKGFVALVLLSIWVCGTGNTDHKGFVALGLLSVRFLWHWDYCPWGFCGTGSVVHMGLWHWNYCP
jgi:hypothetical protein